MIRGTSSLAWLLLSAVACLARPCGAAHVCPPLDLEWKSRATAGQDPKPESQATWIWTGRTRKDGKLVEEPVASAKELRKQLAAIQVVIDVDRDLALAQQKLELLRIVASRAGYPEREAVLVEVALALSGVLEAQGRKDEALAAASAPLLPPSSVGGAYELAPATEADRKALASAANDPRLAALRTRLEQPAPEKPVGGRDAVEEIVRNAVLNRQSNVVHDLGDRALPALEKVIAEGINTFPPIEADPLMILAQISSPRCAEFVRIHFDRGDAIWKARLLRLARQYQPFANSRWVWEGREKRLSSTAWLPVVERLLEEPATARESLEFVRLLVPYDVLTKNMQKSVAKLLSASDGAVAASAMNAMNEGRGRPNALPVFEAGLSSSHADVRGFAAQRLLEYETSTALLDSHGSTDAVVRATVAEALRRHRLAFPDYANGTTRDNWFEPRVSAAQRELLSRLLRDADAAVRAEAATSIVQLPTPVESSVYERIAKDPDPQVRASLLGANSVPLEVRAKCALELASDGDEGVLQSFDAFIVELARQEKGTIDRSLYPALSARWRNVALPFTQNPNYLNQLYDKLAQTGPGTAELLRWSLAGYDPGLRPRVVHALWSHLLDQPKSGFPRPLATTSLAQAGLDVTPTELAAFFALTWTPDDPARNARQRAWDEFPEALCNLKEEMSAEFLPIASDKKYSLPTRLAALQVAARGPGEQVAACLLEISRDAGWRTTASPERSQEACASIGVGLSEEVASKTVAALLEDDQVPPILAGALAYGYASAHPLEARMVDRLLAVWFDEGKGYRPATSRALKQLTSRPREGQGDWLVRASRDPALWYEALPLIGETRDPSYLGLLDELLSGPESSLPAGSDWNSVRRAALDALTRYFSDAAAEVVLKTAGSTASAELRGKCFDALETIRKYQQEKGRWQDDRAAHQASAAAVRDLVAMLDDKSAQVRASAVRGLGALNAVEELPRIVRMLKDPDDGVREAANEMLQKLGAPPAKKE